MCMPDGERQKYLIFVYERLRRPLGCAEGDPRLNEGRVWR